MMMELLGKMPRKVATSGSRSKDFFDRHGDLKRIRRLKFRPLDRLLVEKYKFVDSEAQEFASFLCPLLDFAPEKRPSATDCLQHPWLKSTKKLTDENIEASIERLEIGMSSKLKV